MSEPARAAPGLDDVSAETDALERAVAEARADLRAVPHAEVRAWLLEVADGNFDAIPPKVRPL